MDDWEIIYLFRNPEIVLETWASHISDPVSCSVLTKITQPLVFLLVAKKMSKYINIFSENVLNVIKGEKRHYV